MFCKYECNNGKPFDKLREGPLVIEYCPIGSFPENPPLAVIGFSPGPNQIKKYKELAIQGEEALSGSAFYGQIKSNLEKMFRALHLHEMLGDDFFEKSMLTSMIRCPAYIPGKGTFKIDRYRAAKLCATTRLRRELEHYQPRICIVLGKHASEFFKENHNFPSISLPHPSGANMGRIKKFLSDEKERKELIKLLEQHLEDYF